MCWGPPAARRPKWLARCQSQGTGLTIQGTPEREREEERKGLWWNMAEVGMGAREPVLAQRGSGWTRTLLSCHILLNPSLSSIDIRDVLACTEASASTNLKTSTLSLHHIALFILSAWTLSWYGIFSCLFYLFTYLFLLFRAVPAAYGSSQARSHIGPAVAGHSHSNMESKLCLSPTPQLRAMQDP